MAETIMCQNKPLALIAGDAESILFDNTDTGLVATNVQDAIEESLMYDSSTTIKQELNKKFNKTGGTIKDTTGNSHITIEGATTNDYGQLNLKHNGYNVSMIPDDLTRNSTVTFPNDGGGVRLGSPFYGRSIESSGGGAVPYQWNYSQTLAKLKNEYFYIGGTSGTEIPNTRNSVIEISQIGGFEKVRFHCTQWKSAEDNQWSATMIGAEYDDVTGTYREYLSTFIIDFTPTGALPINNPAVLQWKTYVPNSGSYTSDTVLVDFSQDFLSHNVTLL